MSVVRPHRAISARVGVPASSLLKIIEYVMVVALVVSSFFSAYITNGRSFAVPTVSARTHSAGAYRTKAASSSSGFMIRARRLVVGGDWVRQERDGRTESVCEPGPSGPMIASYWRLPDPGNTSIS